MQNGFQIMPEQIPFAGIVLVCQREEGAVCLEPCRAAVIRNDGINAQHVLYHIPQNGGKILRLPFFEDVVKDLLTLCFGAVLAGDQRGDGRLQALGVVKQIVAQDFRIAPHAGQR